MGLPLRIHSIVVGYHVIVFAKPRVHADEGLPLAVVMEYQGMDILVSSYSSTVHFYGRM